MMRQLCMVLVLGTLVSGCTPRMKEVASKEWADIKSFEYGKTAKKLTGWNEVFPTEASSHDALVQNLEETYCQGPEWAGGRRMLATGINEEMYYGGCLLEAPLPYEPQRFIGRP